MFSIGVSELLIVVVLAVLAVTFGRRPERRWLFGIPAMFAWVTCTTPADPVSLLLVAVPCSGIYSVAMIWQQRHVRPVA